MRRNLITQADFVLVGERMSAALAANTADVPHLTPYQEKLDSLLDQMRELTAEQDALTASKQGITKEIQAVHASGTRLLHLLRKALQEHYGSRNEKLAQYGVQPFRGRPRRVEEPVTPPVPTPPSPPVE
jgi:hypothetical protein